ncbi:S24 family peptidase [Burkholderia glumae]|uniref:S24 family peptidase n=1 Tax=Burkholderia glumae TaxID=337 RepID=UPI0021513B05|nr:S24 family peptidase [Burkholderia glumae]
MKIIQLNDLRVKRLQDAIDHLDNGNVTAFGKRLGYKDGAFIRQMLTGTRNVSEKTVRAIEAIPGMGYWFDPLKSLMKERFPIDSDKETGRPIAWENPDDLEHDEDRVWMDQYDYRFSAGTGHIQWEVRKKKALPFDIGFFKALGVRPQDCRLARVHGRSMEPYLFNRDMMMICEAKTHVRDGQIYAVYFEDEALVKQIFKEPDGALRLHSYNPEFPDRIVSGEQLAGLQIVGEVIYRSGSGLAGGN